MVAMCRADSGDKMKMTAMLEGETRREKIIQLRAKAERRLRTKQTDSSIAQACYARMGTSRKKIGKLIESSRAGDTLVEEDPIEKAERDFFETIENEKRRRERKTKEWEDGELF